MKETVRTLSFVGVALAAGALAWFVSAGSTPAEAEAFAKVGTAFYPRFTDPTEAGSLEITSYDKTTGRIRKFQVELDRGRWRIPSHHGYPADAEDQLEKVAASLIGITRQALAGRRANAHERFGVVQPPDSISGDESLDGLGQRIVLKDKNGNVLADYILGKRVAGQDNLYFVRTPGEDETYRAEVAIEVSTKFGDWIEKDLLKLDRSDLVGIELKTPKFEAVETPFGIAQRFAGEESIAVSREETGPGAKWQTEGLNQETEEIDTSGVGTVQTGLDSLELLGVRPKPQGLTADLMLDLEKFDKGGNLQQQFDALQEDLISRGFRLAMLGSQPAKDPSQQKFLLFGDGGELIARSNEGLVYHMHFGKEFIGTQQQIEVGKTELADEEGQAVEAGENSGSETSKPKTSRNRYLFIRVEFDESLLGEAPKKPEEPSKPAGLKDEPAEEKKDEKAKDKDEEKSEEELKQAQLKRDYEAKLALYKNELAAYEEDNKEYQKKLEDGKAKAGRLNDRFREWYYVIPASSYDNLTFTRADVVKEKEKEEDAADASDSTTGNSPISELENLVNGAKKSADQQKPAVAEKPEAAKPEDAPEPENE